jgi:hypothetical protein
MEKCHMRLIEKSIQQISSAAILGLFFIFLGSTASAPRAHAEGSDAPEAKSSPQPSPNPAAVPPDALGISFVEGSTTTMMMERDGKNYLVDLASHSVKEVGPQPGPPQSSQEAATEAAPKSNALTADNQTAAKKKDIYEPGDDFVYTLPTGRRLERHGFYVNFNHRFAFNPAFSGKARGHVLAGFDDFSISSFGIRYGVTKDMSLSIYRSPSTIGRPIEMMAAYNLLDEHDGRPLNAAVRFSIDGENDFSKNFTANFEGIFSRSISHRAQFYVVPTLSLQNRRLVPPQRLLEDPVPDLPGINTFSVGFGAAIDIRPTVAIVTEVIPTFVNGPELGIHRPAYSIGIQKRLWRHAFTFGFTNGPGTTVAQRGATRASLLNDPTADKPSGLFIGFDLTRQIY